MVRVWFGDRKNAIYNTSVFLKTDMKMSGSPMILLKKL